jgi:hypothetical protein
MGATQLRADNGKDREKERCGERLLISVEPEPRLGSLDDDDDTGHNQKFAEQRNSRANDA